MLDSNFKQLLVSERTGGSFELAGLFLAWKMEPADAVAISFGDFYKGELTTARLAQSVDVNRRGNELFAAYYAVAHINQIRDRFIAEVATMTEREEPVTFFSDLNEIRGSRFDGEYFLPTSIVDLMVALVSEKETASIYCPYFPDPMSLQGIRSGVRIFADHPSAIVAFWAEIAKRVFTVNLLNKQADCIENLTYVESAGHIPRQFDAAIVFPPFGARLRIPFNDLAGRFSGADGRAIYSAETALIMHARVHARRIAVCVPNGFLFKSTGIDHRVRAGLIGEGYIKAVIALPQKIFKATSIAVSIILIDFAGGADEVLFVDAREVSQTGKKAEELSTEKILEAVAGSKGAYPSSRIPIAEVRANNGVLSIERYMDRLDDQLEPLSHDTRKLGEIAEISRPQVLNDENGGEIEVAEVRFSDMPEAGYTKSGAKRLRIGAGNRIFEKYRLRPFDVLVASRGSIGETIPIGIIGPDPTAIPLFPSQLLFTVRINQGPDISGLAVSFYKYLRSDVGQARLKTYLHGTTIPQLSATDMRDFPVPLPAAADLGAILNAFDAEERLHAEITKLQRELAELKSIFIPSGLGSTNDSANNG